MSMHLQQSQHYDKRAILLVWQIMHQQVYIHVTEKGGEYSGISYTDKGVGVREHSHTNI